LEALSAKQGNAFAIKELKQSTKYPKRKRSASGNIRIVANKSAEKLLEAQIERKALVVVSRVVNSSALEEQIPNSKAYNAMLAKAKNQIAKMPKSYIWS